MYGIGSSSCRFTRVLVISFRVSPGSKNPFSLQLALGKSCVPLMFRCLCLPQTTLGMIWLLSFVMCWMFTKLSNQYYVATYLIEQLSQFWWSCEVQSLWCINMWRDCQPGSFFVCVSVCVRARTCESWYMILTKRSWKSSAGSSRIDIYALKTLWYWCKNKYMATELSEL